MSELAGLDPDEEHLYALDVVIRSEVGRQRPHKLLFLLANLAPAKFHPVQRVEQCLHLTTGASRS